MAILGLLGTEQFASERFKSVRRSVFYTYPNGAAPLTGLLSLLSEEDCNDPEYSWYEKRWKEQRTLTEANTTGVFCTTASPPVDKSSPFSLAADEEFVISVVDESQFRVGHVIMVMVPNNSGANQNLRAKVTAVTTGFLKVKAIAAYTNIINTAATVGLGVLVIGSAHEQGQVGAALAPWNLPAGFGNFCQIFRTPFSMTGTALKTSAKFDETGPYKDKAKENSISHMVEIEKAVLWGKKSKVVDGTSQLPTYTMDGVLSFLELWEAGTTYGNDAATLDSHDNKRIIENASGTMNERQLDAYMERLFRVTNNKANEKLCLCGTGFLSTLNQMFRSKTVLNTNIPSSEAYGMTVVEHVTPFGRIFYKTHPLFNQNPDLRYAGLYLDVQNLKYRYVAGRDTELLKNRQPNNADYRMDEWLTECGLEMRFPESCMFIKNMVGYAP